MVYEHIAQKQLVLVFQPLTLQKPSYLIGLLSTLSSKRRWLQYPTSAKQLACEIRVSMAQRFWKNHKPSSLKNSHGPRFWRKKTPPKQQNWRTPSVHCRATLHALMAELQPQWVGVEGLKPSVPSDWLKKNFPLTSTRIPQNSLFLG